MPYENVKFDIFGGINRAMSEDQIGGGEVVDALNVLFRRREAITRPGLNTRAVTGAVAGVLLGFSKYNGGASKTLLLTATKAYSLDGLTLTEITGAGFGTIPNSEGNAEVVNEVWLIGNCPSGLVRWDPAGGFTYTVITTAKYKFVTGHITRAFAAYKTTGAAGDPITVAWSDQGDETVWTTGGASTAGSSILADMSEPITGLATLRNIVVIARPDGFHIGYPTGNALPAFRFESWSRSGAGVFYPQTSAYNDDTLAFVGEDDVYTFDLQQVRPIGAQIRDELLGYLKTGKLYRGFFNRSTPGPDRPRFQYHLAPLAGGIAPHFIYDFYEDHWSRCGYDEIASLRVPMSRYPIGDYTNPTGGVSFIDSSGNIRIWDDSKPCETAGFIELPTSFIGGLEQNFRIDGALLKHRDFGEGSPVKITVECRGDDGQPISGSDRKTIGSSEASGRLLRSWLRPTCVGNGFTTRLDIDAGSRFCTNHLELKVQEAGTFRGRLT